jgi:hypothetical protein
MSEQTATFALYHGTCTAAGKPTIIHWYEAWVKDQNIKKYGILKLKNVVSHKYAALLSP